MGNVCASTRNKEFMYSAKHPQEVISQFDNCLVYRQKNNTKKHLLKKKHRYLRKVSNINEQLEQY